jgi:hypothetical protein
VPDPVEDEMKSRPRPSILDGFESLGVRNGRKLWRHKSRYFTWDAQHGEVEVFTSRGDHLGAVDPISGRFIKGPVKGRNIDVE